MDGGVAVAEPTTALEIPTNYQAWEQERQQKRFNAELDRLFALDEPTGGQVLESLYRIDRMRGPFMLLCLTARRKLTSEAAAAVVPAAWSVVSWPQSVLTRKDWLALFHLAGFTVDEKPADRPSEPVVLYRGAPHRYRRRWSWTADREVAAKFASGSLHEAPVPGQVWTATVPPGHLLAEINGRDEQEFVVDTRGLQITQDVLGDPASADVHQQIGA